MAAIISFIEKWCVGLSWSGVLTKVLLSVLFGTIVGCERSAKGHAAGMRTFMIVALVSTIAGALDGYAINELGANVTFVVGATIIGIALVSSNTLVYSSKNQLKGLTTSVALWGVGMSAVLAGLDLYAAAVIVFVVYMLIVTSCTKIEVVFKRRSRRFEIHLELKTKGALRDFTTAIRRLGLKIDDIEMNTAYVNSGLYVYSITLTILKEELNGRVKHDDVIAAIAQLEYVNFVEELD